MPVVDVFGTELSGGLQCGHSVFDVVVLLEPGLQTFEDVHRLLDRRLVDVDLLKAPGQGRVFFENTAVLGEGGGANAFQLTRTQGGLEQIGRVQSAPRGSTGTNQGVNLVNEQDGLGFVLEGLEHALEALLKVPPVFGASQQGTHVERINLRISQDVRHFFLGDAPGQTLGNGGFTDTGLTHQQRVVFAATAQNLNHALDLVFAANQRVNFSVFGHLIEVLSELLQWRCFFTFLHGLFIFLSSGFLLLG